MQKTVMCVYVCMCKHTFIYQYECLETYIIETIFTLAHLW